MQCHPGGDWNPVCGGLDPTYTVLNISISKSHFNGKNDIFIEGFDITGGMTYHDSLCGGIQNSLLRKISDPHSCIRNLSKRVSLMSFLDL